MHTQVGVKFPDFTGELDMANIGLNNKAITVTHINARDDNDV